MIKGRTTPARKTRLTLYADIGLNLNSAKGDSNEKMVCSGCGPACGCRSQGSDCRRSGEQHRSLPVLPSLEQSPVPLRFHLEVVRALSFMSKAGLSPPSKPGASLVPEKPLSARPMRFHERARHSRVHDSRPSTRSPPGIAITDRRGSKGFDRRRARHVPAFPAASCAPGPSPRSRWHGPGLPSPSHRSLGQGKHLADANLFRAAIPPAAITNRTERRTAT